MRLGEIALALDVAHESKGVLGRRAIVDAQRTAGLRHQVGGQCRPGLVLGNKGGKDGSGHFVGRKEKIGGTIKFCAACLSIFSAISPKRKKN